MGLSAMVFSVASGRGKIRVPSSFTPTNQRLYSQLLTNQSAGRCTTLLEHYNRLHWQVTCCILGDCNAFMAQLLRSAAKKAANDVMLLKNESLSTEVSEISCKNKRQPGSVPVASIDTMENVTATRLRVNRTRNLQKESRHAQDAARELVAQSRKLRERTASIRSHRVLSNTNNCAKVTTKGALDYRLSAYRWDAINQRRDPTSVFINRC